MGCCEYIHALRKINQYTALQLLEGQKRTDFLSKSNSTLSVAQSYKEPPRPEHAGDDPTAAQTIFSPIALISARPPPSAVLKHLERW